MRPMIEAGAAIPSERILAVIAKPSDKTENKNL